jgi:hypothetical protein
MPHSTLGNHYENTQTIVVCCFVAFKVQRWIIKLKVVLSLYFGSLNLNWSWKSYEL